MSVNIHIYPSPFKNESRILKETKSIIELGLANKIIIVATWENGLSEQEDIDANRSVIRIKTIWNSFPKHIVFELLKFISFYLIVFFKFKKLKAKHINAHSLSVLPLASFIADKKNTKLIYDAHELETERNNLNGVRKKLAKYIEKKFIYKAHQLIVVSDAISEWYKKEYNINNCYVIKNLPEIKASQKKSNLLKQELNIPENELLFIYQGVVGPGRGVEILLDVFSKAKTKKHIVFMGFGPHENKIKEMGIQFPTIHFKNAVHPDKIVEYTSGADVGISLIEHTCLSYYYCLPNKVFEYLVAGLPIIVSNFPEMKKVIGNNELGWAVDVNSNIVLQLIESIDVASIAERKIRVEQTNANFDWKKQQDIFKLIYKN